MLKRCTKKLCCGLHFFIKLGTAHPGVANNGMHDPNGRLPVTNMWGLTSTTTLQQSFSIPSLFPQRLEAGSVKLHCSEQEPGACAEAHPAQEIEAEQLQGLAGNCTLEDLERSRVCGEVQEHLGEGQRGERERCAEVSKISLGLEDAWGVLPVHRRRGDRAQTRTPAQSRHAFPAGSGGRLSSERTWPMRAGPSSQQ